MEHIITAQLIVSVITIAVMANASLGIANYLVYAERKLSAYIQDRLGPNRVGFDFGLPILKPLKGLLGLGQGLADGIKFVVKEDYTPNNVDKILFTVAPIAIMTVAFVGMIIVPWGGNLLIPSFTIPVINLHIDGAMTTVGGLGDVNVGVVYLLAATSLGIYGVALGGYASNNKFSFLGSLRATAQMISYEIPMGLSILVVLLLVGSLKTSSIIEHQVAHGWTIIANPLAAVIFFIAILAEANRAPFDNAECEQELVGGYHTEYASMRFALFFLAEYVNLTTSCAMFALLFLGAYHIPGLDLTSPENTTIWGVIAKLLVFVTKAVLLVCFTIVVRWTIPRLRYDQIMHAAWQGVIPLSLAMVVVSSVLTYLGRTDTLTNLAASLGLTAVFLAVLSTVKFGIPNRKIRLAGSRFSPLPGEVVQTRPTHAMALADKPM